MTDDLKIIKQLENIRLAPFLSFLKKAIDHWLKIQVPIGW
jgi:hypothetical protein